MSISPDLVRDSTLSKTSLPLSQSVPISRPSEFQHQLPPASPGLRGLKLDLSLIWIKFRGSSKAAGAQPRPDACRLKGRQIIHYWVIVGQGLDSEGSAPRKSTSRFGRGFLVPYTPSGGEWRRSEVIIPQPKMYGIFGYETITMFRGQLDSLSQGSASFRVGLGSPWLAGYTDVMQISVDQSIRQRISLSSSKPQPAYDEVSARLYRLSEPNPATATKRQYYKLFSTANQCLLVKMSKKCHFVPLLLLSSSEYIQNPTQRHNYQKSVNSTHPGKHACRSTNPTHFTIGNTVLKSSGNPTQFRETQHTARPLWLVAIDPLPSFLLPTFSPLQHHAMVELEAILMRLPDTVLEHFRDEAHPSTFHSMQANVLELFLTNFTTKHPQSFSDTAWVNLDDLKEWLCQQADLNHLLHTAISPNDISSNAYECPSVGLNPWSSSGMDANFGDAMFYPYHPVNFYVFEPTLGILRASVTFFQSCFGEE
ncbi:hypothetical protein B0H14DRAFT_2583954 [Mycena olivaceomarginata]|nr:hypothetical protein B0H14DRAFT_2583954 [Mycena olivaceomarginata]